VTETNPATPVNYVTKVYQFFWLNHRIIVSISLTLLASLFFSVISFPDSFSSIAFFSQRSFGFFILAICLLLTFTFCLVYKRDRLEAVSIWLQSNALTFFAFAYFLRLNTINFKFAGIIFNTGIIFIPITILIFLVNWNLFGKNEKKSYLLIPQVILFSVHTYAFISLLSDDRTNLRNFSTDWLGAIFTLNSSWWLILCSAAIAIISVASMNMETVRKFLVNFALFFFLTWQTLLIINAFGFLTYWYKALLFLIFWDFLFVPFYQTLTEVKDSKYQPKLIISSFYHFLLFLVVLGSEVIRNIR